MYKIVIHKKEQVANLFFNMNPAGQVYFSSYERINRKDVKFSLNGLPIGVYFPDLIKEVD